MGCVFNFVHGICKGKRCPNVNIKDTVKEWFRYINYSSWTHNNITFKITSLLYNKLMEPGLRFYDPYGSLPYSGYSTTLHIHVFDSGVRNKT